MKMNASKTDKLVLALAALVGVVFTPQLHAQTSTAFTYQGSLTENGAAANAALDFTFTLYNAASGGGTLSVSNVINDLVVSNGLFTVTLDFGEAFGANALWLQIGARPGASTGAYTVLAPRQRITTAPYAVAARTVTGPISGGLLVADSVNATKLGTDIGVWRAQGVNCWRSAGSVGIGTITPNATLDVVGVIQSQVDGYGFKHSSANGGTVFSTWVGPDQVNFGTESNDKLVLVANNGAGIATLLPNGNFGVGTFAPATRLDVAGEATMTACNITSDRNAKELFKPVNPRAVLDKVVRLPISEWQYKTQSDARHIGPVAQDFRAAFAVGRDEKHIATVDADGVALAAIQGLNEKLEEKSQEVEALKKSVAELRELVNRLAQPNQPAGR